MGPDEFDAGGEYAGAEMEGPEVGTEEVEGLRRSKTFALVGLAAGAGAGAGAADWKSSNSSAKTH